MDGVGSGSGRLVVPTRLLSSVVRKFPQPPMLVDEQSLTETGAHVILGLVRQGWSVKIWDGMSACNLCTAGSLPRD